MFFKKIKEFKDRGRRKLIEKVELASMKYNLKGFQCKFCGHRENIYSMLVYHMDKEHGHILAKANTVAEAKKMYEEEKQHEKEKHKKEQDNQRGG